ncbi:MAG: plastocyanin/azurin family copper-binding protein [Thermaerobacter sp.]|nr:plastocyanin/azurin family copper-binding protein [Thermaerobacter sp.]
MVKWRKFAKSLWQRGSIALATAALLLASVGNPATGWSSATVHATTTTTWHVMVGNGSPHMRVDGMQYFPGVITIDAGDTVVWTLAGAEPHTVSFLGGAPPPVPGSPASEQPVGGSIYTGQGEVSSGLLLPIPGHNQYQLTFPNPGVYSYRCLLHPNQQGVVIVNPAGTPYPQTAAQYAAEGQAEWQATLNTANAAQAAVHPTVTAGPNGHAVIHAFMDAPQPPDVSAPLTAANNSGVSGTAVLSLLGPTTVKVEVTASGLAAGSTHAVEIRPGDCQTVGAPLYTLPPITANAQGQATLTTTLSPVDGIAAAGWVVDILSSTSASSTPTQSFAACGAVSGQVYALMRYEPNPLVIHVGDEVIWTQANLEEIHTVTFLAAGQAPPAFPSPQAINPAGGSVYTGSGYVNSGILAPFQSYHLVFAKSGIYPYLCTLHDEMGMDGTVEIRAPGVPLTHAVFFLTHHPVGWYGPGNISLQRAADALWQTSSPYSVFALSHRPVGALGAAAITLQRDADLLWLGGIPRK